MTLRITLRNPTRRILHLQAILNSSDSFMFAGHRQVWTIKPQDTYTFNCTLKMLSTFQLNVSIFAYSSYDLLFNLCPLKAGWQPLPELELEYQSFQATPTATPGTAGAAAGTQAAPAKLAADPVPGTIGATTTPPPPPSGDDVIADGLESQRKAELASLVQRWMPKMVFVHVSGILRVGL